MPKGNLRRGSSKSRSSSSCGTQDAPMDGSVDSSMLTGSKNAISPHVCAIFVHAGAGYHSVNNEVYHLRACDKAAKAAMAILTDGGSAVAAVEAAIQLLEDIDVTNAGYGSNLTIDGVVEGDATIVDHNGRSGACGATSKIQNPIKLARLILDGTTRELSLRRVPPNLLVGQGATDFAYEHGLPVIPLDGNISSNSRDRWRRWHEELRKADAASALTSKAPPKSEWGAEEAGSPEFVLYEDKMQMKQRRDHTNALLTGTWNEGQPDSPQPSPRIESDPDDAFRLRLNNLPKFGDASPPSSKSTSPERVTISRPGVDDTPTRSPRHGKSPHGKGERSNKSDHHTPMSVSYSPLRNVVDGETTDGSWSPLPSQGDQWPSAQESHTPGNDYDCRDDMVTDTVGAIAIDSSGNIAAGSSSGGIGMKHRGRVGPAALVGVGTAVIPAHDPENDASVAICTSGTGEHMATTMAAQKCGERLSELTKRTEDGELTDITEEEALYDFVRRDFMGHPGVKASHSPGAIGVMAVKKCPYGYFLYFAHNTESFALASMHSNEGRPKCVMSRLSEPRSADSVVQGGRKVPLR